MDTPRHLGLAAISWCLSALVVSSLRAAWSRCSNRTPTNGPIFITLTSRAQKRGPERGNMGKLPTRPLSPCHVFTLSPPRGSRCSNPQCVCLSTLSAFTCAPRTLPTRGSQFSAKLAMCNGRAANAVPEPNRLPTLPIGDQSHGYTRRRPGYTSDAETGRHIRRAVGTGPGRYVRSHGTLRPSGAAADAISVARRPRRSPGRRRPGPSGSNP